MHTLMNWQLSTNGVVHSSDTVETNETAPIQVACISVTVSVRLRRAVQGFMNNHIILWTDR